ncbi:MAG TPA: LPS assembly lipoprotein LptE [Verrucomicrobiae bacterium]
MKTSGQIFSLICALAVLCAGCAGYHLGPVTSGVVAGAQSIEIVPFNNQTLEPRLGDAVTQALREHLQADGTYRLATGQPGDIVVTGVITHYSRSGVSFLATDINTAQSYNVIVTAHVIARERSTGKLLLDKNVNGETLIQTGSDLQDAERQSMPVLAEDLSRNITELLTEGPW